MQEKKEEGLRQALNKVIEVGIDEVGRGAVFGPVFSAAVLLPKKNEYTLRKLGVTDSKKLTSKKRDSLFPYIILLSSDFGIGQSSVREIEKFGIRFATELSMLRALSKLRDKPSEILIDGTLSLRQWNGTQKNIVSGDSKITSIAAASIIAKVTRDLLIDRLDKKYLGYFLSQNKGYGTKKHFLGIKENGITNMHRKSFLKKSNLV